MNLVSSPYTRFRSMQEKDLPVIMEIERLAYSHPWSRKNFEDCLQGCYRAKVLELNHRLLVGYGLLSVGAGEAHVLNLCVHPHYRRRGYGKRILNHLVMMAKREDSETIFLEVRVSNSSAIGLYRQTGFNEVGVRKNYYPREDGREDGLIFAYDLQWSKTSRLD